MRYKLLVLTVAAGFASSVASAEMVEVHGSTTVAANLLTPKKAQIEKAAGVELQIVGNGSGRGLGDLVEGKAKMAMISAPLADEANSLKAKGLSIDEAKLRPFQVGPAHVAFAVHPSNPVKTLTGAQIVDVLSGTINTWKDLGGPDKPIVVVCESKGGGVRSVVEREILANGEIAAVKREVPNMPQVVQIVGQLDQAIGLVSRALLNSQVAELKTDTDVVQPLILVTMGDPAPELTKIVAAAKAATNE
jgi:phosphate transport system substrate-binding protein